MIVSSFYFTTIKKEFIKKFLNIKISIKLLRFIILNFPLPKKILNFILMISSEVFYSNNKIKRELDFNPKFSLLNYTKLK